MKDIKTKSLDDLLQKAKKASHVFKLLTSDQINNILIELAESTIHHKDSLIAANRKDLARMNPSDPKYDRLYLNDSRIETIANDLRNIASLPEPLNSILEETLLPNGLLLKKVTVPIGTIGIVFESRPNVTFDVFSICLKTGNAVVLKGSKDAEYSNLFIVGLIHNVLRSNNVTEEGVLLAPSNREALLPIIEASDYLDLIIPRGSQGLIDFVRNNSKVPIIETGAGIVHTFADASADIEEARKIVENAKTRRVSVCNALDTLLVHRALLHKIPSLVKGLDLKHQLVIFADDEAYESLNGQYQPALLKRAQTVHFGTEFLSMQMSIKVVADINQALEHIQTFSSKHSEAILSKSQTNINRFLNEVDSAVVYANASTGFTDGVQFGMGAEIGISTQKIHARGPMGLKELTSYKWIVEGSGQVRP